MAEIETFPPHRKYKLDPEAILRQHGIEIRDEARYYTTCPRCSAKRKKQHQKIKCLGVSRPDDGRVYWGCNHCDWTGPGPQKAGRVLRPNRARPPQAGGVHPTTTTRTLYNYSEKLRKVKIVRPDGSKRMWWEHNAKGWWEGGTNGIDTQRLLYRFATAKKMALLYKLPICIVEGEKDVDCLMFHGFPATCNAHGASEKGKAPKWLACHSEQLARFDIAVFNDDDAAGVAHREAICRQSYGVVRSIVVLYHCLFFPGTKDITQWFKAGGDKKELRDLIEGAPDYVPEEWPPNGED
jgi:hypothetical protein